MKYVPAQRRDAWNELERYLLSDQWDSKGRERVFDVMFRMVKGLHEAGARLIVGTDCPIPFEVPGFSLHGELQNFVDAGLTPYAALKAATRDAAELLDALDEFGTVAVGRRADLILVEANPLDDVANVTKRVGVMVHGQWISESEFQEKLDLLAEKIAKKDTSDARASASHY
jgi:imidazolonepropionase-like amidohydrolase